MSLRLNLYSFSIEAFQRALGSNDEALLKTASEHLAKTLDANYQPAAQAWLRRLINEGHPLQDDRAADIPPADGELLTVRMEAEPHIAAFAAFAHTLRTNRGDSNDAGELDLAGESSTYSHPAVEALGHEILASRFFAGRAYVTIMGKLRLGTPLFGDDFRTSWSFYSVLRHDELFEFIPILEAAIAHQRPMPSLAGAPPEHVAEFTAKFVAGLSEHTKTFARDLITWFTQIRDANRDALILWW